MEDSYDCLSWNWIKSVKSDSVDLYPIQFANCIRLEQNDAVYILDEVGSGKTISSGLMALSFLANHNGNVLVITANSLVKCSGAQEYGQFLNDWFDKLPLKDYKNRIRIVNNHYTSFRPQDNSEAQAYGLVIIDEAHFFLNEDSLRHRWLVRNIRAAKIVFLTATPIKTGESDLHVYTDIAQKILQKAVDNNWPDSINTATSSPLICAKFDTRFPATRYFKDTIMYLNMSGIVNKARRLIPEIWEYSRTEEEKKQEMLDMINAKYEVNSDHRFVVFVRFVTGEAKMLGEFLEKHHFSKFKPYESNGDSAKQKTYSVITGETAEQLVLYTRRDGRLPTVLILTYQIAEQGVNLPGFDHIINYHIPAFPSALEQRFGRIDRLGKLDGGVSGNKEIRMCFLIAHTQRDSSTFNFYSAIQSYLHTLLSYLPSKNTILSLEALERYVKVKDELEAQIDEMLQICDSGAILPQELANLCEDFGIPVDTVLDFAANTENTKVIKAELKKELRSLKTNNILKDEKALKLYENLLNKIGDKIFYRKNSLPFYDEQNAFDVMAIVDTVDAIDDCGKQISTSAEYKKFRSWFNNKIQIPLLFKKIWKPINKCFEDWFDSNQLDMVFPFCGYRKLLETELNKKTSHHLCELSLNDEQREMLLDNADIFIRTLPFFQMYEKFKEILHSFRYTTDEYVRERFYFNPFTEAMGMLYYYIKKEDCYLSKAFREKYWGKYESTLDYEHNYMIFFNITGKLDEVVAASNWYKLAFACTRKENCYRVQENTSGFNYDCDGKKLYAQRENILRWLMRNSAEYERAYRQWDEKMYEYNNAYSVAMDGEATGYDPSDALKEMGVGAMPESPEIISKFEEQRAQLKNIQNELDTQPDGYNHNIRSCGGCLSLFHTFMFTPGGNFRTHIADWFTKNNLSPRIPHSFKVIPSDIWTQGILMELYDNISFTHSGEWRKELAIPEDLAQKIFYV